MIRDVLLVLLILIAVLLIVIIMLQPRGSGIGTIFGGVGGEIYRSRRGMEKLLHYLTIFLIILFSAISLVLVLTH